jgi:hypothetical protein
MYETGGTVLGATTTAAGVLALPNTGSSSLLAIASVVTITVGVLVAVTSIARMVVKKAHKA